MANANPHDEAGWIINEARRLEERLIKAGVPEHLRSGLVCYLLHHIPPGHFLTAVLENDLMEAMGRADELSLVGLFSLVSFLYNDAPSGAWGSPAKVRAWLTDKNSNG